MTDAPGPAAPTARGAATRNPLGDVAHSEAADRLRAELLEYLAAQTHRLLVGVGRKLGETTVRLTDIAEGRSEGLRRLALDTGRRVTRGRGPLRSVLEAGATHAKDNVLGTLKGLGDKGRKNNDEGGEKADEGGKNKKGGGGRPTVIVEHIDVGVPLRTAYDQWTRYQDLGTFAEGDKSASRGDDTHTARQAKVWWAERSGKATTTEQVPDDRIAWSSEGAKGTTRGVVSFHRLGDNLTRVMLVIEYYPSGFLEKTGNLWRAQGRRTRLDLKDFARFTTLTGEAEDAWEDQEPEEPAEPEESTQTQRAEEAEGAEGDLEEEEPEEEEEAVPEDAYEYEDDEDDDENAYETDENGTYAEDGSRR
ncbi:SRPBCC family protein [Streptomyces sp. DH24]|uniref:SRPBCC family protein n=1 Tax=Streptomyces sp. DH24 TaxID=3040123 RepID=UPI0024422AB2|nr:SRPBCC family protein [Streptomyces sp. DH24]MDG9717765.1 SRPBCC family protein [Streptomyces sp. DH24]